MTTAPVSDRRERTSAPVEVNPHRWALSPWARAFRRLARRWTVARHVRRFCRPLVVDGEENLARIQNPLVIIANHTSHFDTVVALSILPDRIYNRTAVVAAADRMYRERIKGMWHSLRYNAYPITRGGGRVALAYSQWLLRNGWSLLIFPEGRRSRSGDLLPFHPGPAILALSQRVPVLPVHIEGSADVLPPGTKYSRTAPVRVRIGQQIWFDAGTSVDEAKQAMEEDVRSLAIGDSVLVDQADAILTGGMP